MPFPTAAVFPVILVVLDVYPFKRLDSIKAWWKSKRVHSVIFEKLIFLAIAVIVIIANIVLVSYNFRPANHVYVSLAEFGILDRLMQAFYVWAYYLWRPFYPVNLSPLYTILWKEFNPLSLPFIFSALGIITATSIIFAIRKRYPSLLTAWICYLILLIPALGLNMHPHSTADRYSYAVSMILSVLLAGWMLNVGTVTFRLFCIGITVILIFLGIASNKQISVWHDTPSLMRHILITTSSEPNLPYRDFVYHRLANYYLINGRYEESISPLTEAIQMNPKDTTTYFYRGISYYNIGNYKQAIEDFGRAIELSPGYAEPYYTRGVAYLTHGDNISGCPDARKACELGNCKLLEAANTRGLCR
jgi:tetratricopeptide (TPR) repeat protein